MKGSPLCTKEIKQSANGYTCWLLVPSIYWFKQEQKQSTQAYRYCIMLSWFQQLIPSSLIGIDRCDSSTFSFFKLFKSVLYSCNLVRSTVFTLGGRLLASRSIFWSWRDSDKGHTVCKNENQVEMQSKNMVFTLPKYQLHRERLLFQKASASWALPKHNVKHHIDWSLPMRRNSMSMPSILKKWKNYREVGSNFSRPQYTVQRKYDWKLQLL